MSRLPGRETSDDLRWYASHEALARHSICDVLNWLADELDKGSAPGRKRQLAAAWEEGWNAHARGDSWDSHPHYGGKA